MQVKHPATVAMAEKLQAWFRAMPRAHLQDATEASVTGRKDIQLALTEASNYWNSHLKR
jgi:hypothetical protein